MNRILLFAIVTFVVCSSCREEDVVVPATHVSTYKVAVIAPASEPQWRRTAEWALANIRKSQSSLPEQVDLKLVWIDESDNYLNNRMKSALSDSDIVAVVGPIYSSSAKSLAALDVARHKPLIFPCATSTDLHRMYANCDYIWTLSANDVEEIEIMLMQALTYRCRQVHLLAHDDAYGETFLSWTDFVAKQFGLRMGMVESFKTTAEEVESFKEIASKGVQNDYLIYVPSGTEDFDALNAYIMSLSDLEKNYLPHIICSDGFPADKADGTANYNGFDGLEISASVESGFLSAYRAHFGTEMSSGESQFYDSFLLLSLALTRGEATGNTLSESLKEVASGQGEEMKSWLPADMTEIYEAERRVESPDICGASGSFWFREGSTSIEHSTYRHWQLNDHRFETIEFLTTTGTSHTLGSVDILSWKNESVHEFKPMTDTVRVYPPLDQCWALLVAGTKGWDNYRHQADIYAIYQLLRNQGYADDHIIVIAEDDIAYNLKNQYPGVVRVENNGENVYDNLNVTYYLSDLKPSDLRCILCGESKTNLQEVFPSHNDDNVFIYWCGEGNHDELVFGDYVITGEQMTAYLQEMSDKGCFRKLFFAIEACYSGSIGQCLEGIPGLLCMTAANENETSKADVADPELGVWLSNGFTRGFRSAVSDNPEISFYDLYFKLVSSTWGSHVCIYNESNFSSVYETQISEFLPE